MQDFRKKQGETLDYVIDWTDYLKGDPIVSSSWAPKPDDEEIDLESVSDSYTAVSTTVWIAGGAPGQKYVIENTIETAAGRVVIDHITVYIEEVST